MHKYITIHIDHLPILINNLSFIHITYSFSIFYYIFFWIQPLRGIFKMAKCKKPNQSVENIQAILYEVEQIVEKRINKAGIQEFKIRWKGYSSKYDTWQPRENLQVAKSFLNQFNLRWGNTNAKQNSPNFTQKNHPTQQEAQQKLQTKNGNPHEPENDSNINQNTIITKKRNKLRKVSTKLRQQSQQIYKVEAIVGKKYDSVNHQLYYKVRWEGYLPSQDTWEPFQNLKNAKKLVQMFQNKTKKIKKEKSPANKEYEVLRIVGKRFTQQYGTQYKVRWKGYKPCDDTWQPAKNLFKVKALINIYQNQKINQQQIVNEPMITQTRSNQIQNLAQTDNYEIGGVGYQQQLNSQDFSSVSSISMIYSQKIQINQDVEEDEQVRSSGIGPNQELDKNVNKYRDRFRTSEQDDDLIMLNLDFDKEIFEPLYW